MLWGGLAIDAQLLTAALLKEQTIYWALALLLALAFIATHSHRQNRHALLSFSQARHHYKQLKFQIMQKDKNPVVITEEDYRLLKPYVDRMAEKTDTMSIAYEVNRAIIVKTDAFPANTVKLNSKVSVLDMATEKIIDVTIVMPENADMRRSKISVLTPMSAALIGFRKGEEVKWKVPLGMKHFRILDVVNA